MESLGENREQETTSLSGTSLSTSHQVTAAHDDGNRVLLNWGRDLIMSEFDVLDQVVIERRVGELENWLWNIVSRSFNWDIIVLLEVDTSLLFGWVVLNTEELTLHADVGRARNMLAITPLSITRATSRCVWSTSSSTAGGGVTISVLVEGRGSRIPSCTSRRAVGTGLEVGSRRVGPAVGTRTSTSEAVAIEDKRKNEI